MSDQATFWLVLNKSGRSYSEIGAEYGVSRNTVAGAIFRLKNPCLCTGRLMGERHPAAKLTTETVREIRKLRSEGAMLKQLASDYGVSMSTISLAARGKLWSHVSA